MMRGGEPEGELIMLKRKLGAETKARAGLEQSQKILEEELLQMQNRLEMDHHERIELEKANRRLVQELTELRKSQAAERAAGTSGRTTTRRARPPTPRPPPRPCRRAWPATCSRRARRPAGPA